MAGLTIKITEEKDTAEYVRLDEAVWWNADRTKLVPKGDPEAAFAYAAAGQRVPKEQAERDGLLKAKGKGEDKQRAKAEDKSA